MSGPTVALQPSLLDGGARPSFDRTFAQCRRHHLGRDAWVDVAPGWLRASDVLFDQVLDNADWGQSTMRMYDDMVVAPRLSTSWNLGDLPAELALLRTIGATLSGRYRTALTRISANLYRDGRDSVAWHGDRVARDLPTSTIAVLSLGHRRTFRLRPRGGGASLAFDVGRGDLVVMGGSCQRTWQHSVPKVRDAGPRICVMFREAYTPADLDRAAAARRARRDDPRTA